MSLLKAVFTISDGEPVEHCHETAPGVWTREWTKALVALDCNSYTASIKLKKGNTVNRPSLPEEAQRARKELEPLPQQERSAYPKRGLSGLSGCDDAAALNLKGNWEYNWDLWPVCVDADGGRTPEGSQPCTTPRAAEFVRECNIFWSDFATAV